MLKKLFAFIGAMAFCATASAGFVQYDFSDVEFDDGGTLQGFFIQDSADKSIAFYNFRTVGTTLEMRFGASGQFSNLLRVSTNFHGQGPTNIAAYDALTDAYYEQIFLEFSATATRNLFAVSGFANWRADAGIDQDWLSHLPGTSTIVSGFVIGGEVTDPMLRAMLDSAEGPIDGITNNVPARLVPEPGTYALMLIGAAALASTRKSRKKSGRRPDTPFSAGQLRS